MIVPLVGLLVLPNLALQASLGSTQDTTRESQVASLTMGMDTAAVRARLGRPEAVSAIAAGPGRIVTWKYRDLRLDFSELRNSRLFSILILTRRYATFRGLRLGDSRQRLYTLYGAELRTERCTEPGWYEYPAGSVAGERIALTIRLQADTVSLLQVSPALEEICISEEVRSRSNLAFAAGGRSTKGRDSSVWRRARARS